LNRPFNKHLFASNKYLFASNKYLLPSTNIFLPSTKIFCPQQTSFRPQQISFTLNKYLFASNKNLFGTDKYVSEAEIIKAVKKCSYGKLPLNFSPDRKGKPGEGNVRRGCAGLVLDSGTDD
jgi:hypothetical protein